ncbi:MAG: DUF1540 domain-containing protein [Clostridiales bacterium]|nr:DUF1540 domain-containing protein [Clostridiales bacterium]
MDIKCKKCDCKHNKGCTCCAEKIKVGKNIDCETYEFSEYNSQNFKQYTSKNMFEISSLEPQISHKDVKIYCDAKCLFNKQGICHANGITVLESNYDNMPNCVTQINK